MSTGLEANDRLIPTLWHEVCDKCGTRMDLRGVGGGFERWTCPFCRQVVGIDRDPRPVGATSCTAATPWRWSARAFRT